MCIAKKYRLCIFLYPLLFDDKIKVLKALPLHIGRSYNFTVTVAVNKCHPFIYLYMFTNSTAYEDASASSDFKCTVPLHHLFHASLNVCFVNLKVTNCCLFRLEKKNNFDATKSVGVISLSTWFIHHSVCTVTSSHSPLNPTQSVYIFDIFFRCKQSAKQSIIIFSTEKYNILCIFSSVILLLLLAWNQLNTLLWNEFIHQNWEQMVI